MKRIKLPSKFINITNNILLNRSCQVINEHGLTNKIKINDGIDQGETPSPLWWIIFYDPLISSLSKQNKNHSFINTLAYMDDLNLLAKNKTELQTLTNISEEFFLINDIAANPLKTKLIIKTANSITKL